MGPRKRDIKLKMSENKVPMRIAEHKVEELTGGWRKLDDLNLHNLLFTWSCLEIKSRKMQWRGRVAHTGG
jgi:hypothetical protein